MVETEYLTKPFLAETIITREEKPKQNSPSVSVIGYSNEQCLVYARRITGIPISGYAGNLQPNTYTPTIGGLALEKGIGHISVIVDILPDGSLVLNDANWIRGAITKRIVSPSSQRGYII